MTNDVDALFYELCVNVAHVWHDRGDWDGYIYFWTMRMGIEPPDEHAAYQRYKDESVFGDSLAPYSRALREDTVPSVDEPGSSCRVGEWVKPGQRADNRQARRARAALARKRM